MLKIDKQKDGDKLTVTLYGEINTNSAKEFDSAISSENFSHVVFDFKEVEYISSAGLRVLLACQNHMDEINGIMVVRNINETVEEIFDMTGFSDILTVE